jgi:hypothetical protein
VRRKKHQRVVDVHDVLRALIRISSVEHEQFLREIARGIDNLQ